MPTLPSSLDRVRALVDPALREAVDELPPLLRRVSGYHFGWIDAAGRPQDAGGGKALRPALTIFAAEAAGGRAADAVPAATAVELVHNFSLLHDDVMDGDEERRHRPTAWTLFGIDQAMLAGSALLTLAVELLARRTTPDAPVALTCLTTATQRLIAGQSDDLAFTRRDDVTVEECLAMEVGKTGALLECSAAIGAIAVGAPRHLVDGFGRFGAHLGVIFQLVDDLLGIWGATEATGKPVMSDIRSRKRSAPIISALRGDGQASERLRRLFGGRHELTEEDVALAAKLVEEAGGRDWATQLADDHEASALALLDQLGLDEQAHGELVSLTRFIRARDR